MNSYAAPSNRDEYFFDLCREAGFRVDDPGDWSAMSTFGRELVLTNEIDGN